MEKKCFLNPFFFELMHRSHIFDPASLGICKPYFPTCLSLLFFLILSVKLGLIFLGQFIMKIDFFSIRFCLQYVPVFPDLTLFA